MNSNPKQHSGTIATGQTTATVATGSATAPHSFGLASTAGGRAISVSIDGTNFFALTPTFTATGAIMATVAYPIAAVQFTGAAGDKWTIL